jgi:hypothetical protein
VSYLCQVRADGLLYPASCMLHSLSPVERRRSKFENEGFAIFKAFQEFVLLIRDRQFTVITYHQNLTLHQSQQRRYSEGGWICRSLTVLYNMSQGLKTL